MVRAAALALALLAATPAAAADTCLPADEAVHQLRASLPPYAFVKRAGPRIAAVIRAWVEDQQFPGAGAEGYLEVGGDRGLAIVPIRGGTVCYGAGVNLGGESLRELQGMVRRYRELTGLKDGEA